MEMSTDRSVKLGLLWHSFRCANLGVGALTISHLAMLREAAQQVKRTLSFQIIGPDGPCWYPPPGLEFQETIISRCREGLPGSQLHRAIAQCDVILDSAGGDSFSDIYGGERLIWMSVPKLMALLSRKPLILSPQTIGPFEHKWARFIATQLSRRCATIFTRDNQSRTLLEELGVTKNVEETVDVAFRLPFESQARRVDKVIRFGLNVSGLLYAGGYTCNNQFRLKVDYRSLIDRIINTLLLRRDVAVILIPHVIGDIDDDVKVSRELAHRFGIQMAPIFTSPSEAKSFISGLDILAGSRMHATIAAISAGVSVVPLAYSRKFGDVFRSVDYPILGELTKQDIGDLAALTVGAIDRIAELSEAARRSNVIAQKKLNRYQAFLGRMLAEVV